MIATNATGKRAGADKRASKQIYRQLEQEIAAGQLSPDSVLGPIGESSTQSLLISLIQTLNASFPDYDFRSVGPET